jgi:DNA-binding CsgD family transcriptional regulator/PAS domain-containing protein
MTRTGSSDDGSGSVGTLVRAIHAAGLGSTAWSEVLGHLRRRLDAKVVTLGQHEFASGGEATWCESPGDERFGADLATYAARNPWFLSSEDYVAGRVMTGEELISNADLRRTDFYRGFLRPRGLLHLLCGVVAHRAQGTHFVSVYRAEDQAAFGARERAELGVVLDHLTLSLEGQWRWQEADELAHALLALTDREAGAAILVTGDGTPIYRNPAAEQLLERQLGVRLDGERVVAASGADRRLLAETIARQSQADATAAAAPAVLTLACAPPLPPVVAVVRAAGQVFSRQAGTRRGLAMIAVRSTHAGHDPATCVFARRYELTAAQARVSALVFAGQPLSTIAHSLNLSENTVRSHLKQIYQKTETHGQMELVHLHARVCPTLP